MAKTKEAPASESPAVLEALRILSGVVSAPDVHWIAGDGECSCLFQQIGDWNNPHLGRTLRVRVCCLWAKLYAQYPECIQVLPYYDQNRHTYNPEPQPWNSTEMDMPVYLWHRQLAVKEGKTVEQIREEYAGREHERPKKVKTRKHNEPTPAEVLHAHTQRLIASGWLLPGQAMPEAVKQSLMAAPAAPVIP